MATATYDQLESLTEYVSSPNRLRVDKANGVIRGVKILGLESRNGRTYLESAMRDAAPLYEGVRVNVNHPKGRVDGPRDYQDRIGYLSDVALQPGKGLYGNLYYNPKHPLAEQLAWDAEHSPSSVGLSHNVMGRTGTRGGKLVIESIRSVKSVDLVADPATTSGLYESVSSESAAPAPKSFQESQIEAVREGKLPIADYCHGKPYIERADAWRKLAGRSSEAELSEHVKRVRGRN